MSYALKIFLKGEETSNQLIVNLASVEYSQAIIQSKLKVKFINISFTEYFNHKYQTVGIYAKKARGKMTRFLATNNISQTKDIKNFDYDGYKFASELSSELNFSQKFRQPFFLA